VPAGKALFFVRFFTLFHVKLTIFVAWEAVDVAFFVTSGPWGRVLSPFAKGNAGCGARGELRAARFPIVALFLREGAF
jgi:hypothetical protein